MISLRQQTGVGFKTNTFFQAGKVVIIAISTVCTTKEAFHVTSLQATGENHATFEVTMYCAIVNVQCKTKKYVKSLNQATKNFNSWGFFSFQSFLLCDSFFKIAPSIKHQIATQTVIKKLHVCQVDSAVLAEFGGKGYIHKNYVSVEFIKEHQPLQFLVIYAGMILKLEKKAQSFCNLCPLCLPKQEMTGYGDHSQNNKTEPSLLEFMERRFLAF